MFEYISEEDSAILECPECGLRIEEQILMDGVLVCPDCGATMEGVA